MDPLLPIDLVGLVGTIMGISIVLIPVIGLTARFALKPVVDAMAGFFQHRELDETVRLLDRRMSLIEQQLESLDSNVQAMAEAAEFHRALSAGAPDEPAVPAARQPPARGGGPDAPAS